MLRFLDVAIETANSSPLVSPDHRQRKLHIVDVLLHGNSTPLLSVADSLEEVERAHILRVLQGVSWVIEGKQGAAARLGLHPNTLRSRMQKHAIKKPSPTA